MSLKMPFGKFKGVLLADLPDDYLAWLRSLGDLREPLKSAVILEWQRRTAPPHDLPSVAPEVKTMAEDLVTAGYRKLAQVYHPDHGGEGQTMTGLNLAAEFLRAVLRAR